jgi:ribosomal protein S6
MSETNMPAAEAIGGDEQTLVAYELAFHVLPTVAEGEVPTVVSTIIEKIVALGGVMGPVEAPERIELAYDIEYYLEGRHRRFSSAYFGWVRFELAPAALAELSESLATTKELLRHLVVKLSKAEAAHPFYYHAALDTKTVSTVDVDELGGDAEAAEEVIVEEDVVVEVDDATDSK